MRSHDRDDDDSELLREHRRRRGRPRAWVFPAIVVASVTAVAVIALCYQMASRRDREQLSELNAESKSIKHKLRLIRDKYEKAPDKSGYLDDPEYKELTERLIRVTGQHNAILNRHPNWPVAALEATVSD